jgi:hypothetical protein
MRRPGQVHDPGDFAIKAGVRFAPGSAQPLEVTGKHCKYRKP